MEKILPHLSIFVLMSSVTKGANILFTLINLGEYLGSSVFLLFVFMSHSH